MGLFQLSNTLQFYQDSLLYNYIRSKTDTHLYLIMNDLDRLLPRKLYPSFGQFIAKDLFIKTF